MGEYLKINGQKEKLGTCENLYYTTYAALKSVIENGTAEKEEGNDTLEGYLSPKHGYRYRFPFPDEDNKAIGTHEDYERGELFTINRENLPDDFQDGWNDLTGWSNSPTQKHLRFRWSAENPNNKGKEISFEIVQQKIGAGESEGLLTVVFRCPFSGGKFRIENKEDLIQIVAAISDKYLSKLNSEKFGYYDEFCRRIYEGYNLPYTSKREVLIEL